MRTNIRKGELIEREGKQKAGLENGRRTRKRSGRR